MTRWLLRAGLLALLILLGVWGYHFFFPTPQDAIRRQLTALAKTGSIAPNESRFARAANAMKLIGFFSPDVQIKVDIPGSSPRTFDGLDDVRTAALAAGNTLSSLSVEFLDVNVEVAPDKQSAIAQLTAKAVIPGQTTPEIQELKIALKKNGRDWLVTRAETMRTLR